MAASLKFIQGQEEFDLLAVTSLTASDSLLVGGFSDQGAAVIIPLLVHQAGYQDLARHVRDVRSWLQRVEDRAQFGVGDPVYVEYEPRLGGIPRPTFGPGPLRKRLLPGSFLALPDEFQGAGLIGNWIEPLTLSLQTETYWRGLTMPVGDATGAVMMADDPSATGIRTGAVRIISSCTNLVPNPSFEIDTAGWATSVLGGGTAAIARIANRAKFGYASLRVVTDGAASAQGARTDNITVTALETYAASVWIRGAGSIILGLQELTSASASVGVASSSTVTLSDTWQRITVSRAFGATGERARLLIRTATAQATTFYLDNTQLFLLGYCPPYFDGDSGPGFTWSSTAHNSTSVAAAPNLQYPTAGILWLGRGSVELWVKPSWATAGPATSRRIWQHYIDADNSLSIYYDGANTRWTANMRVGGTDQTALATKTLVAESWYHVVVTWQTGALAIYADGTVGGTTNALAAGQVKSIAATFYVGRGSDGLVWDGDLILRIWDATLTAANVSTLYAAGRPRGEMPWAWTDVGDGAIKNQDDAGAGDSNWVYVGGIPGDIPAPLQMTAKLTTATGMEKLRIGVRAQGATLYTPLFEAETAAATYDGDTATVADAATSGGNKARTTASTTTAVTRFTSTIVARPGDLKEWAGQWRVYARVYDGAAATGIYTIDMRPSMAGVAGSWSDTVSAPAVGQWNLVELGTIDIPLFGLSEDALTRFYERTFATAFYTLDIRLQKASGSTTFDFDYLLLMPVEQEGTLSVASGTWDQNDYALLDFTGDRPIAGIIVDDDPQEWAGNFGWEGDVLHLIPARYNRLVFHIERDAYVDAIADALDVALRVSPRFNLLR